MFGADEALAGGLVRSVHEPDDLLPAARAIAAEIAEQSSPVSVALTRRMLWSMLGADHPMEAHRVDSRAILERGRSADAREGVESFLEKRAGGVHRPGQRRSARRVPGAVDPKVLVKPPLLRADVTCATVRNVGNARTRTSCDRDNSERADNT